MRHVHPNDPSCFPHGTGRQKAIKAGPTTEIKDDLAWP
jgi:hypothetical protein